MRACRVMLFRTCSVMSAAQIQLPGYSATGYAWNRNTDGPYIDFTGLCARTVCVARFKPFCSCDVVLLALRVCALSISGRLELLGFVCYVFTCLRICVCRAVSVSYVIAEYPLLPTAAGSAPVSGTIWSPNPLWSSSAGLTTNVYMLVLNQNWFQVSFSGTVTDTTIAQARANSLVWGARA